MENNGLKKNEELIPEEKSLTNRTLVNYSRVLTDKRKNNPIKGLVNTIKGIKGSISKKLVMKKPIQKPLPSYGLGAYPPPKQKKPVFIAGPPLEEVSYHKKPVWGDMAVTGAWGQGGLINNSIFENILMVIIIIFLLKWLFGFSGYNY
jgi:hypothetical protein